MRVVILGEDTPGALMTSYARAFKQLGMEVRTVCLARTYAATMPSLRHRAIRRAAERVLVPTFNDRVVGELRGLEADLVLVIKGQRLTANTVDRIRESSGGPVVNFYPDDPFSREHSNRLSEGPGVFAAYDACFTFARHLMPEYDRAGARAVHYLPFARDPDLHAPPIHAPPSVFDVVFVGNLDDDRVRFLEAVAAQYRVAVFGERTREVVPRRGALARATFGPAAYGSDLAKALALGNISLNVMRTQNAGSHNMRSFESPACGAFTMSQRTPELTELFAEGEEIVCFGSVEELREVVPRWLADAAGRRAVGEAGFARVRDDTYLRRAATILDHSGVTAGFEL